MQTLNNFFDSKKNAIFLFILSFSVVIVFSFLNVDYSDNPFQINIANYFLINGEYFSVISFFSQYVYSKIILVFNDSLVNFKLLNSLLILISVYIPLFFFRKKINHYKYISLASLALLLFVPFSRLSIGWDAISDVFFFLTASLFIKYVQDNRFIYLFFIALAIVFATYTKITNILLLFFIVFSLIVYKKIEKQSVNFIHLFGFIFFTIFFFNIFLYLFFDSPIEYYNQLLGKKELNDSYGVLGLLERIYNHLKFSIKPLLLFFGYYIIFIKYNQLKQILYLKILWYLIFVTFAYNFIAIERGFYNYILVISSFILGFLIVEIFFKSVYSLKTKLLILFLILMSFFPTIGSNTGLSKNSLILFMPLILAYFHLKFNFKNYNKLVFLIGVYVVVLRLFYFIDFQKINSDFVVNEKKLYPMVSHNTTKTRLDEVDNFIKTNAITDFYFYSLDAHLFEYYFNGNLIFKSFDRDLKNGNEWNRFFQEFNSNNNKVYLFIPKNVIKDNSSQSIFMENINKYNTSIFEVAGFFVYQFN